MKTLTPSQLEQYNYINIVEDNDQIVETTLFEMRDLNIPFICSDDTLPKLIKLLGDRRVVTVHTPRDGDYGGWMTGYLYLDCTKAEANRVYKITDGSLRPELYDSVVKMWNFEIE